MEHIRDGIYSCTVREALFIKVRKWRDEYVTDPVAILLTHEERESLYAEYRRAGERPPDIDKLMVFRFMGIPVIELDHLITLNSGESMAKKKSKGPKKGGMKKGGC